MSVLNPTRPADTFHSAPRSSASRPIPSAPPPDLFPRDPTRVEPLQLRRAPLLLAAVCFCLGELLAALHYHPPALLLLAAALLVTVAILALRHAAHLPRGRSAHLVAVLPVAALWITTGTLAAHLTPSPERQSALLPYADNLSRTVVGRVVRTRLLPPPATPHTADSEHTWQPDVDPTADTDTPATQPLQLDLALTRIEELTPDTSTLVPIAGGVRITLYPPPVPRGETTPTKPARTPALRCGDLVEIPVRLRLPQQYRDPGAWQYADFLRQQGIAAHGSSRLDRLTLLSPSDPLSTASGPASSLTNCRLLAAQAWASARLARVASTPLSRHLPALLRLSSQDTGMLAAMLFGDRSALTHQLRLGFERTGSFHLFVVSGMHVALLAGLVYLLLRSLRLRGRRLVPDTAATLLTLPLITAYALLTGFGAPVQRALFMTCTFLIARLLSRDRSVLNAFGAAVLLSLLGSPHALFESSFQMTSLAIVAIAGIAVPLGDRGLLAPLKALHNLPELRLDPTLPPPLAQLRVTVRLWQATISDATHPLLGKTLVLLLRWAFVLLELALVGLIAELVMALPMAIYFHRATLFALPANMISVPLIGVLMPLGILTFLASLLSPTLGTIAGLPTAFLLHGIRAAINHFSQNPLADVHTPSPAPVVIAAVLATLAFCCWAARRSRNWAIAAAVALPLLPVAILWPEPALRSPGMLELTALDVGQGDSLLLVGAEGNTMLIDAGGPTGSILEAASATSAFDVGEEVVAPYLWSRRIRRLDTLVLSHAHSDHMGGMPAVLADLHPRELWVSLPAHAEAFDALLAQARAQGTVVRFLHAGEQIRWGDQHIDVLSPDPTYTNPADPRNDDSLVLRVTYGRASVLLEGDAEAPSERAMLAAGRLGPVTLLKVGHHGSLTSTTPDFLATTRPSAAVISAGLGNHFGHPRPQILERLAESSVRTARTDEFGLTTYLLSRDGSLQRLPPPGL